MSAAATMASPRISPHLFDATVGPGNDRPRLSSASPRREGGSRTGHLLLTTYRAEMAVSVSYASSNHPFGSSRADWMARLRIVSEPPVPKFRSARLPHRPFAVIDRFP